MNSKQASQLTTVLLAVAIVYLLLELKKKDKQILAERLNGQSLRSINQQLLIHNATIRLELGKLLDKPDGQIGEITEQLKGLLEISNHFNEGVKRELESIPAMLQSGLDSKVIFALVKIVEDLLKRIYLNDTTKVGTLGKMIEQAKNDNLISKEDYHLLMAFKEMRNEEAHEPGVVKPINAAYSSIILCMILITKLTDCIIKRA